MERTEEQKIMQEAITVSLGGKKYEVKPLVIKDSRGWRVKLVAALKSLPQQINTTSDPTALSDNIQAMFLTMPDMAADLFFAYAKDLNREEIEAAALDSELAVAFEKVVELAFPLALTRSLTKTITTISR